jgi:hypothetical protein
VKQRYAYSPGLGKQVPVEEVELDPPARRKKKRSEFTVMELEWAADMAKATGTCGALVWIVMRYLSWKAKSPTFAFTNTLLTRYGVTRQIKYRVLEKLEAAGKIKVEHRGAKKASIVTFLTPV